MLSRSREPSLWNQQQFTFIFSGDGRTHDPIRAEGAFAL